MARSAAIATLSLAVFLAAPAAAQNLRLVETVQPFQPLSKPVWAGSPPGDDRIFVLEQHTNLIRIIQNGSILSTPFLDLSALAQGAGPFNNERGLLGMAFHPNFRDNGHFFVDFTASAPAGATMIRRYTVSAADPNVADPASAKTILTVAQPASNHNAGQLAFGPDGYLYVGFGDGGNQGDPNCNAQNPGSLLGKLLRLDVDTPVGTPYAVPPDNPFVGQAGFAPEIWALGLRNPWRYSFDRLTGDLYIGDVGQSSREEVDFQPASSHGGENYGWKVMEGVNCFSTSSCGPFSPALCNDASYSLPISDYAQTGGGGCSVIGGFVYRGCAMPFLQGTYVYADYCNGKVRSFVPVGGVATNPVELTADLGSPAGIAGRISSFGEDGFGEILMLDHGAGVVYRLAPENPVVPDSLCASGHSMSIGQGGTQFLRVQPGAAFAGELYWVFGSATGTTPGLPAPPFTLPLNFDNYFQFTVDFPNLGVPLVDTLGVLDANGEATAQFFSPPGAFGPTLAGFTLNHAGVVFDLGGTTLAVTGAQPIAIQP